MFSMPRLTASFTLPLLLMGAMTVHAEEPRFNQISLRAEASQEVQQDLMTVTLYAEEQNSDPAQLAEGITRKLNEAIEQARQVDGVKISSGQRNSAPVYEGRSDKSSSAGELVGWREHAELKLQSGDFAALSDLTGKLLQTLQMGGIQFGIADETRAQHEDELITSAIEQFQKRAQLVSDSLGGTSYRIVRLDLNSNGNYYPVPMPRAYAAASSMKMDASPIAVEAGTTRLSITADGQIEVQMPQR